MNLLTFVLSAVAFLALCVSVNSAGPLLFDAPDATFQVPSDSDVMLPTEVVFAPSRATTGLERDHPECISPAALSASAAIGSADHGSTKSVSRCTSRHPAGRANTSVRIEPYRQTWPA